MLDKSKTYAVRNGNWSKSTPSDKFGRIKILYEDEISFYAESLTNRDKVGFGIRFSLKKHCFVLVEVRERLSAPIKTVGKIREGSAGEVVGGCVRIYDRYGYPIIELWNHGDINGVSRFNDDELQALAKELVTIWNERVDK